ncbi:MAG TPA: MotA/TolQ/ExbB proton channel family protein [Gemmataceae bacterium]|jgi:biopolymer transport protein ExbB|nr:MotA/TolQ/ExbB proton channel family protein [Gemmataceae bacterium]
MNALTKFITEEWYFFLPMLLLSLVAAALVVWRFLLNLNARTNLEDFLPILQDKLQQDGVESALKYCRNQSGVIPRKLYAAGLENSRLGLSAMKRAMANAIEFEILPDLNFLLPPILAIAKVATMVGLFLTVISMINTFTAISDTSKGGNVASVTNHSAAIGLALFGTAGGLMIAIPLVFTHVLFKARVASFEIQMKSSAQRLLMLFQTLKPKQGDLKGGAR